MAAMVRILVLCLAFALGPMSEAQDLSPRAYLLTPTGSNAINLTYSRLTGGLLFDGAVPITGATATINLPVLSYYHAFALWGRSANITAVLPYGVGEFHGTVLDAPAYAYRSGLLDSYVRLSVNLKGGPALKAAEFAKWRQKVLLGASFKIVMPTGQYNPTALINWGNNRWAFKPEFGYSQRWAKWVLDAYGAVWFFTTNPEFFSHNSHYPGVQSLSEEPVGACEGHLSYEFKPRLWISLDGNFWFGGKTSLNGVQNPLTLQRSSRVGISASIPFTKHQSVKMSYSNGAYISYGGNYQNFSLGWQYSWIGWRKSR